MATQARGRPLKFHTSQWEGMAFSVWRQLVRRITDTHVLMNREPREPPPQGLGLSRLRHGADSGKEAQTEIRRRPGTMG